jgi:hypothetical protein
MRMARNRIPRWIDEVEPLLPGRGYEGVDVEEGVVVRRLTRRGRRVRGCEPSMWVVIGGMCAVLVLVMFTFGFVVKELMEGRV